MLCLLILAASALATPPSATLDSLDAALQRLADADQVDHFRVTTTASYADEDGDDAHVDVVLTEIRYDAAGEAVNTKLSHTRDGEPVEDEPKDDDDEKKGGELSIALPAGEDLPRYSYGPTTQRGPASVASFEPAQGEPSADDLATGEVAWDPTTGRPLWITFSPIDKPMLVKSLHNRLIIGETGGLLHTERIISKGVGGPPLMRKKFEMDMRFHDVAWK